MKHRIVNNVEFKTFTIKDYVVPYCTEDVVVFSNSGVNFSVNLLFVPTNNLKIF